MNMDEKHTQQSVYHNGMEIIYYLCVYCYKNELENVHKDNYFKLILGLERSHLVLNMRRFLSLHKHGSTCLYL